ncbi:MAG: DUF2141 domain-containing protein, partial [Crocinitomicaceae bacterium]|nr:DUF2141 domain-containing protein [Crocinitomicaceae bacterium]
MKLLFLTFILLFSGVKTHTLSIHISGISKIKGSLFIAVFRATDDFPVFGKQYKGIVKEVEGKSQNYTFDNLPEGEYALAIYQDENRNKILDKNLLGIPTEIYGFSNNARRNFSAPSFQEAKFKLNKDLQQTVFLK